MHYVKSFSCVLFKPVVLNDPVENAKLCVKILETSNSNVCMPSLLKNKEHWIGSIIDRQKLYPPYSFEFETASLIPLKSRIMAAKHSLSRTNYCGLYLLITTIIISISCTYSFTSNALSHTFQRSSGLTHIHSVSELYSSRVFDDFKTNDGEIIDPYAVLKISKKAEKSEIKKAYWSLSKRYHPDQAKLRDILPGKWYVGLNQLVSPSFIRSF